MSKRSYRRLAVVTGAALALGSMAPAMAARLDVTGGAGAEIDPALVINDVTNIADGLGLPGIPALPAVPNVTQVGLLAFGGANGLLGTTFAGLSGLVGTGLGGIDLAAGDCGLVAVASCNGATNLLAPVNVLAPVTAPVVANVSNVLGGNLLGGLPLGGLLGGLGVLGGILDVSASGNVGVLSSVLGTF